MSLACTISQILSLILKFKDSSLTVPEILWPPKKYKSPLPLTDPHDAVPHAVVLYTDVDGQCDKLVTDDRHQFVTLTFHLK